MTPLVPGALLAAGAAVTNLGYTPANKAGGQLTGWAATTPRQIAEQHLDNMVLVAGGLDLARQPPPDRRAVHIELALNTHLADQLDELAQMADGQGVDLKHALHFPLAESR